MSSINISELRPVGYDLLLDNENYLEDLNQNEIERVVGGTEPISVGVALAAAGAFLAGVTIGIDLNSDD